MNTVEQLLERRKYLCRLLRDKEQRLKKAPPGHLRIGRCRTVVQYYHKTDDAVPDGTYMLKGEAD